MSNQTPVTGNTQVAPKDLSKILGVIAVLLTVLIILVGIGIYKVSTEKTEVAHQEVKHEEEAQNQHAEEHKQDTVVTKTATPTKQPVATVTKVVAKNVVPAGWKPIKVAKYHYTAYRPSNYYYRLFDGGKVLGIDQNAIPEVGGYAGIITLEVTTGDLEDVKMERIDNWMAIATDRRVEKNATWDLVTGTIPGDEMMPEQQAILAITKKGNYVYVVQYQNSKSDYDTYEDLFYQFYPAILFE